MRLVRRKAARGTGQRGSVMVESALTLLLFLMFLLGIFDFGRMVYCYNYVSYAARRATRYASMRGNSSSSPVSASDIQTWVRNNAVGVYPSSLVVTTTWSPDNKPGSTVQVRVRCDFQPVIPFLPNTIIQLKSTSKMVIGL